MVVKCQLVEKVSKKGTKYICLEMQLTETYKKIVFLTDAEIELIRVNSTNKN